MCSALYGVRLEKFFIAHGNGGNGKGVINELLGETLGNYYYKGNSESFTKPLKEGNNPQVANMHNKRLVIIQEVESDNKRLNGTVIKELTGGNKINTRANYSNITQITILATFILECNKKPKIDGRIDESYARRLDDIPFESTFTDKEYLLNAGLDNVFKANTKYKDDKFREDFKNVLFNYLLDYMKNYMKENNKLITAGWKSPKIILDRTAEYLESSDDVKEWFNTKYNSISNEYTTIKDKVENGCFVECKLVYHQYKESQYFNLLTKKQKREQNLKWFYEYMKENINFKVYYKEKYTIGNKTYRNILLDHEEKPIIDEEENDEDDI
jgi:phage/plasmid-associated DNA primase